MQISSPTARRAQTGYALTITLAFLAVALVIFASVMYWVSSNASVTLQNNQFNMSEAAAEAGAEKVLSQMTFDYTAQTITNDGVYYGSKFLPGTNDQAAWPVKYIYSDTNGVTGRISVRLGAWTTNTVPLESQYAGLYGQVRPCTITATATPVGQRYTVPATINESIQFASIPLFQFAVFYNMDLEIDPGAAMTIAGAVWSNGGIWSGTPNVSYSSTVAAVGTVYYDPNAKNDPFCSGKADGSTGTPIGNFAFKPVGGNDRINMPIGTNNDPAAVAAILNLPPAAYAMNTAAAFTTNGQFYLANEADLYLTNFPSGTNWGTLTPRGTNMILYYQDAANGPTYYLTQIPYDFFIVTNRTAKTIVITNAVSPGTSANLNNVTNVLYGGYSFVTNVLFYDWREGWSGGSGVNSGKGKAVQAVQIDVTKFNIWLTNSTALSNGGSTYYNQCKQSNHKSHPINSIYVYNSVPLSSTTLPAVRLANGEKLPSQVAPYGFTVATPMPMYVWSHYNAATDAGTSRGKNSTTYTLPAALMADSITILSAGWTDASPTTKRPAAQTTTVNAAMVEGIVRSTNSLYSGGLENFLRLLEGWGSIDLWYNGSIVVMFPSQYATNYWVAPGGYYDAPGRKWAFDTNFTVQAKLPPLTPQSKGVIRANWAAGK